MNEFIISGENGKGMFLVFQTPINEVVVCVQYINIGLYSI